LKPQLIRQNPSILPFLLQKNRAGVRRAKQATGALKAGKLMIL
jgi:hypothetical protein